MKKKLQVFVSSTYTDLIDERQAAVQAILDAGHIPAGMELFKAGNDSQLKTIYKWIDASDVYMLILGGRYGTIESTSGKSYTHLEYEYAISKKIPVFAVILNDTFLSKKCSVLGHDNTHEQNAIDKYESFKKLAMSKVIRTVEDCKDISISILTTLNEFMDEYDLTGWVRNTPENNPLQLTQENTKLIKENASLKAEIQKLKEQINSKSSEKFGNYTFDELIKIFKKKHFTIPPNVAGTQTDVIISALNFYIIYYERHATGIDNSTFSSDEIIHLFYNVSPFFISFQLYEKVKLSQSKAQRIQTTRLGDAFYAMLEAKGMTREK